MLTIGVGALEAGHVNTTSCVARAICAWIPVEMLGVRLLAAHLAGF